MVVAEKNLFSLLKKENLCIFPVNKRSNAYALGLLWGVSLSWPAKDEITDREIKLVKNSTERIARENSLKPNFEGPEVGTGGALICYCGFETPLLVVATQRAKDLNKPIWQVCEECPDLIALLGLVR